MSAPESDTTPDVAGTDRPTGRRDLSALANRNPDAAAPATPISDEELSALVHRIAELADDKRAAEIVAVDLRGASAYADAFVVCTGNTERQVKAIHDGVLEGLKHGEPRILPRRVEGLPEARWILIDLGDVVVHAFVPEARQFYRLESLWGDRPRFELPTFGPPAAG